jgi:hypothetical protein
MLSGGNFAWAVSHSDCITVKNGYITCEMECCKDTPCLDDFEKKPVQISDDSDPCCKLHYEQSTEQDFTMPVLNSPIPEKNKQFVSVIQSYTCSFSSDYFPLVTHKLKTSNIILTISNLRI